MGEKSLTIPMPMKQTENRLCDLTDYGLLKVSGIDAKKLLQGQLTCDLEMLSPGGSCLGAHCNPQGRIVSLFYLGAWHDAYYLVMPRSLVSIAMTALKKYALFYKTTLVDVSDQFTILGYQGPQADLSAWDTLSITLSSSTPRYLIISEQVNKTSLWEKLSSSACVVNANTWKCLNINEGIPAIYPETSSQFLPHEINLPQLGAISFEKGCYTGQEIIARMHYRGKLKTHLRQLKLTSDTALTLGGDIPLHQDAEGQTSGTVVDACQEEYNHYYALIITRK